MQKWQQLESADDADWQLAIEREAVIRPLAGQAKLQSDADTKKPPSLHLSRSVFYVLSSVPVAHAQSGI
jgi:hypothetical protein